MNRTDAVEHVLLQQHGEPLSPSEIHQILLGAGRSDDYESVGATLAHLGRTDRAHAISRGQWVAGAEPAEDEALDRQALEFMNSAANLPPAYDPNEEPF